MSADNQHTAGSKDPSLNPEAVEPAAPAGEDLPAPGQELSESQIQQIIEAALLAAEGPLTVDNLFRLFSVGELSESEGRKQIRQALQSLEEACSTRGVALRKVASGYRYQTRQDLSHWVSRLWEEKPPRYTRALLETLALVAYKQPVTRGDIEQVRGVSVSQNIMRTLLERDWIQVVGQREAPGRPSMYGTTRAFLDYFNLSKLDELPPMEEIKAMIEPTLVAQDGANLEGQADAQAEAQQQTQQEAQQEAQHETDASQGSHDSAAQASAGIDNTAEGNDQPS